MTAPLGFEFGSAYRGDVPSLGTRTKPVAAREKYLQSVVHAAAPRASSCVLVLDHSAVLDSQVNAVTLDELHDVVSLPRLVALPTRTHFS
jgi:hypothetical protein